MENNAVVLIVIAVLGMLGSGFTAFGGSRLSSAELRGEIKALRKDVARLEAAVDRLEKPYFNRGNP